MKKLMFHLLTLFLFLFVINLQSVHASTEVYKITDPFHVGPPAKFGTNFVHFYTYVGFNYKGGDIIISSNPDGTGDVEMGDILQVSFLDNSPAFTYRAASNSCLSWTKMSATNITSYFKFKKDYILLVRLLDACGNAKDFGSIYIVIKNIPEPSPTPTITPSPTLSPTLVPSPTGQQQFLDLPWDYKAKGLSFSDAALAMNSYFDHTYPLLSSSLIEPDSMKNQVTTFLNERSTSKNYSSHDGYDYARQAKVYIGDPVLAAAGGDAQYIDSCAACGNMIVIDHHNGYQTRYLHLQKDDLVVNTTNTSVHVSSGQQIGKVGATGKVIPAGDKGAHIHFMVIQDKDHDGNFNNNLPDGVTDPFGWQSSDPDPWESYLFNYNGKDRVGNKSSYLWIDPIDTLTQTVASTGGVLKVGKYDLTFPAGTFTDPMKVTLSLAPILNIPDKSPLGPVMVALAKDPLGRIVTLFQKYVAISIDFGAYSLSSIKPGTLAIYSSTDGANWTKEATVVDMTNKVATTRVNHFTQFALMGERLDAVAPSTKIQIDGVQGEKNWFRSSVTVTLKAKDSKNGIGVDYTMYRVDDSDWEIYSEPFTLEQEGHHSIEFYSADLDENTEEVQKYQFNIDTTVPEAMVTYDHVHSRIDIIKQDQSSSLKIKTSSNKKNKDVVIKDRAGNILNFTVKSTEDKNLSKLSISNLSYNDCLKFATDGAALKVEHEYDKKKFYKVFNQLLQTTDGLKVKLSYKPKIDKTQVAIQENGTVTNQEDIAGLKTIKLVTEHGELLNDY